MDLQLRRREGLPRGGLWVSAGLHALVLVVLLLGVAAQPQSMQFETFQIEIVATSEVPALPAPDDLVIETPQPAAPDPEPEPETPPPDPDPEPEQVPEEVVPEPEPEKPAERPEPKPEERPVETPPAPATPTVPADEPPAEDEAEETGSNVNVRLEGLRRDYPVYYANIVQQISNCFRPPPGNSRWQAVVYFEIRGDGTVSGVRPVERSGSQAFDLAAIGAVADCAGRGRFGPLPEDLPYEVLPVQFTFRPRGIGQ